jgi:hypothetical protein
MENWDSYQYKNCLNIFSLALGPFEKNSQVGGGGFKNNMDTSFENAGDLD